MLASVKASLAALGGCAGLDPGCAPWLSLARAMDERGLRTPGLSVTHSRHHSLVPPGPPSLRRAEVVGRRRGLTDAGFNQSRFRACKRTRGGPPIGQVWLGNDIFWLHRSHFLPGLIDVEALEREYDGERSARMPERSGPGRPSAGAGPVSSRTAAKSRKSAAVNRISSLAADEEQKRAAKGETSLAPYVVSAAPSANGHTPAAS